MKRLLLVCCLLMLAPLAQAQTVDTSLGSLSDGADIFQRACQACHGSDGHGSPLSSTGFTSIALPDFTDCSFASREASADWVGIVHEGGPLRGFTRMMPSFGKALTINQLEAVVEYIHSFCKSPAWPRGEFNLPRSLVTGKAYVEDETVLTSGFSNEGDNTFSSELVWEKRLGARSELELKLPFGWQQNSPGNATSLGDVAIELKHVAWDDLQRGSIISVASEFVLPTGDVDAGFSADTAVLEPSILYGQILPADFFLQSHLGFEFPANTDKADKADKEMFWRTSIGRGFQQANWGRSWTPMLELLGARELDGGATEWDLVPQMQISLSKRQHIQLNLGVQVPLTNSGPRSPTFMMYFLWDWFDGGLREGW